jgi:hypothetical protein
MPWHEWLLIVLLVFAVGYGLGRLSKTEVEPKANNLPSRAAREDDPQ